MKPLISIIVPVYNVEKFLDKCVNSLLNQSYQNLEIILVNDGSNDNSGNICNNYRDIYKNIKVIHHEHSSGSAGFSRNSGLKIALGDYISFIDSDDWIHHDMLKSLLMASQKYNTEIAECDLVRTDQYFINELNSNYIYKIILEERSVALKRILITKRFSVCVRLYKSSLIKEMRFPENVIAEDVYFSINVLNKISCLVRIEAPFYYYHLTPESITRKKYTLKFLDSLNSSLYVQQYFDNNKYEEELLTAVQHFILKELYFHYKMLNYFPNLDHKYLHRKRIKKLIDKNYFKSETHDLYVKLANSLSITLFEKIINLNKLRNKIFRRNHFN